MLKMLLSRFKYFLRDNPRTFYEHVKFYCEFHVIFEEILNINKYKRKFIWGIQKQSTEMTSVECSEKSEILGGKNEEL